MAIAQMEKVIIVTHRSQASELLEALQYEGICHILNADEAIVTQDAPELITEAERPRDLQNLLNRLTKGIEFLKGFSTPQKGFASLLAPRTVIDAKSYNSVITNEKLLKIIDQAEQTQIAIDQLNSECENLSTTLDTLAPWSSLETPVEEIGRLQQATCLLGLIPSQHLDQVIEQLTELDAAIQPLGTAANKHACIIIALNENLADVQKLLRSAEYEPVSFEGMTGTVTDLIDRYTKKLDKKRKYLQNHYDNAAALSENLLNLQILQDHYTNILNREHTRGTAPATEKTVILEAWVKKHDYSRLEKLISGFDASSLTRLEPVEGEMIPVDIENKSGFKPFEVITRLYGMPDPNNLDPTPFLAPFFALFFGICLTDVGYGLLLSVILWLIMRKFQGDKKAFRMMLMCAVMSVVAGAVTGGWFSDAIQNVLPEGTAIYVKLNAIRSKLMLFDPMKQPMVFFAISLILGYTQVLFGLLISCVHKISRKRYLDAIFNPLTWIIFLNSLVLLILSVLEIIPKSFTAIFAVLAVIMALTLVFCSVREGGWGARIGMGVFQLFSTVFYFGDVLSYVRLMALGMVTGGLGIAINILVKLVMDKGPAGYIIGAVLFVAAHIFNLAVSLLSAFVHTLRLQYVEFFPKFLQGGGEPFKPLQIENKHVFIES